MFILFAVKPKRIGVYVESLIKYISETDEQKATIMDIIFGTS